MNPNPANRRRTDGEQPRVGLPVVRLDARGRQLEERGVHRRVRGLDGLGGGGEGVAGLVGRQVFRTEMNE